MAETKCWQLLCRDCHQGNSVPGTSLADLMSPDYEMVASICGMWAAEELRAFHAKHAGHNIDTIPANFWPQSEPEWRAA